MSPKNIDMGHRQKMTDRQRLAFDFMQYDARRKANKGHKYQYYSEKLQEYIDNKGYEFFEFTKGKSHRTIGIVITQYAITSEKEAKFHVKKLKDTGYYARIICG